MKRSSKIVKENFTKDIKSPYPVYSENFNKLIEDIDAGMLLDTTKLLTGATSYTTTTPAGTLLITHGDTAALATLTVTITNTLVTENSVVMASIASYGGTGTPIVKEVTPTAGTITVEIYNAHATLALSANFYLSYAILA